ncbi:MAG: hydrogenase maturation protease [Acidimicrobiales bacterium]
MTVPGPVGSRPLAVPEHEPASRTVGPVCPPRVVLAGIGNEMRGDDGVGPVVARRAAQLSSLPGGGFVTSLAGPLNEPLDLLEGWGSDDLAIVVDAVRSGAPPGAVTLTWLEQLVDVVLPAKCARASTHGLGVADVFRLAGEIGLAPQRVALVGVEGQDFSPGVGLSAAVEAGAARALALVVDLARAAQEGTG